MFGSSQEKEDAVHAHFMSEAGIMDIFVLLGPKPHDVSTQFASLTGSLTYKRIIELYVILDISVILFEILSLFTN